MLHFKKLKLPIEFENPRTTRKKLLFDSLIENMQKKLFSIEKDKDPLIVLRLVLQIRILYLSMNPRNSKLAFHFRKLKSDGLIGKTYRRNGVVYIQQW